MHQSMALFTWALVQTSSHLNCLLTKFEFSIMYLLTCLTTFCGNGTKMNCWDDLRMYAFRNGFHNLIYWVSNFLVIQFWIVWNDWFCYVGKLWVTTAVRRFTSLAQYAPGFKSTMSKLLILERLSPQFSDRKDTSTKWATATVYCPYRH